jgi:hypothetical protein
MSYALCIGRSVFFVVLSWFPLPCSFFAAAVSYLCLFASRGGDVSCRVPSSLCARLLCVPCLALPCVRGDPRMASRMRALDRGTVTQLHSASAELGTAGVGSDDRQVGCSAIDGDRFESECDFPFQRPGSRKRRMGTRRRGMDAIQPVSSSALRLCFRLAGVNLAPRTRASGRADAAATFCHARSKGTAALSHSLTKASGVLVDAQL